MKQCKADKYCKNVKHTHIVKCATFSKKTTIDIAVVLNKISKGIGSENIMKIRTVILFLNLTGFEECRRTNDTLICPLCRSKWTEHTAPPNTRASSPTPSVTQEHASDVVLPHAEPIPPEHMAMAERWIPVKNNKFCKLPYLSQQEI